ncbi:MAG: diguanylate cyclase [Pseudomonadales bacterium]|nr:diguanylate cyclase [Pseudomonadales bacterium]
MPVLAVLLIVLSTPALASLDVGGDSFTYISLASSIRYVEDSRNQFTFEDVLTIQPNDWKHNSGQVFSKGYSRSAWWLKIHLSNSSSAAITRYLEIAYPNLDDVQVHIVEGKQHSAFYLGDRLPFHQRPIQSTDYVVPVYFQPNSEVELYLRVRTHSSVQVPLTLWKKQDYFDWNRIENLLQGFYFGIMMVMILYNLFVFLAVRQRNFILYVCFASTLPLFIAGLKGFSFEYIWPNHPQLNDHAIIIPLCLALVFGALFTENFLKVKKLGRWAPVVFRIQENVILLLFLMSFFLSYRFIISILIPAAVASCCLGLMFGILMWNRSGLSARYYTLGWSAFLIGGLIMGLNKLGLTPSNAFTENTLQVGSGIEVILLSFALAASINEDRRVRSAAQSKALEAERETRLAREQALQFQQQAAAELERKVEQRTAELESLNRQLSDLSDTDQLTRLKNRRYLDRVLQEELARCQRYHHDLSIILLDIDHFKQFNDRYGHLVGDECLRAVADVLAQTISEGTDCIARYGGEEFCVLMPETSMEYAEKMAERLRSSVNNMKFSVKNEPANVSISLGVASLCSNRHVTPEHLIKRADQALYKAKQAGRNRTVVAGKDVPDQVSTAPPKSDRRLG